MERKSKISSVLAKDNRKMGKTMSICKLNVLKKIYDTDLCYIVSNNLNTVMSWFCSVTSQVFI